ncbi:MAG: DUF2203 family protein, partial [Verrucomicrobia bacterium]|nr:DUF2203 family protein [Verrucomicrobiota bacterium]
MKRQFRQHYTREDACALLPQVRKWLEQAALARAVMAKDEQRLESLAKGGHDIGGASVNSWLKSLMELRGLLREFERREIQIKDLERG